MTERMPEEGVRVMSSSDDGTYEARLIRAHWRTDGGMGLLGVTHWQPLPDPPKVDGK